MRNLVAGGASLAQPRTRPRPPRPACSAATTSACCARERPAHIAVVDDELEVVRTVVAGTEAFAVA